MSLLILTVGATPSRADPPAPVQPIDKPAQFGRLVQLVSGTSENPEFVARYGRWMTAGTRGPAVVNNLALIAEDPLVGLAPRASLLVPGLNIAAAGFTAAILIDHYTGGHVYHMLRNVIFPATAQPAYDPLDYNWLSNQHLMAEPSYGRFRLSFNNLTDHYWPYQDIMYDPVPQFGASVPADCSPSIFNNPMADAFSWDFNCIGERNSTAAEFQAWQLKTDIEAGPFGDATMVNHPGSHCTFRGFVPSGGCGYITWSEDTVREQYRVGDPTIWDGGDFDWRVPFTANPTPDPDRLRHELHLDPDTEAAVNHALEPTNPNFPDPFIDDYPALGMPNCHDLTVSACTILIHEIDDTLEIQEILANENHPDLDVGKIISTDPGAGDVFPGPGIAIKLYTNPSAETPPVTGGRVQWFYDGVVPDTVTPGRVRVRLQDPDPTHQYMLVCGNTAAGGDPGVSALLGTDAGVGANFWGIRGNGDWYFPSENTTKLWLGADILEGGHIWDDPAYNPTSGDPIYCVVRDSFPNGALTPFAEYAPVGGPIPFEMGTPFPNPAPPGFWDSPPGDGSEDDPPGVSPNPAGVFVAPSGECICPTGTLDFSPITNLHVGNNIPFGIFHYAHDIIAPLAHEPVRPALSLDVNFDVTSGGVSSDVGTHEFAIDIPETWFTDVDDWFAQMRHWESLLLWVGAWWALLKYFLKLRDVSYGLDTSGMDGDIFGAYGRGELSAKEAAERLL